jgi:tetratricopeptide (TPR) repeat protein
VTSLTRFTALVLVLAALPAAAQTQEGVVHSALVGLARVKRDAGDLRAAAEAFKRADRQQPLDWAVRAELFWVLADVDAPEARTLASRLLDEVPKADAVRDRAIELARAAGDEDAAVALARIGSARSPSARWHRRIGESFRRRREFTAALESLRAAVAAPDASADDAAVLAYTMESAGDIAGAHDAWTRVPAETVNTNDDWSRSRLRVTAAVQPDAAIAGLEPWVTRHADDRPMRTLLIDLLTRAGRPQRALDMLAADGSRDMLVREAALAIAVNDLARAIKAQRALAGMPGATIDDRLALGSLLVGTGRAAEALAIAVAMIDRATSCGDEGLTLVEQVKTAPAIAAFRRGVAKYPPACPKYAGWVRRATSVLMSVEKFADALDTIRPLAGSAQATRVDRENLGRLLLWTGKPVEAIAVLSPIVREQPGDQDAAEALVDAYRLTKKAGDAWRVAAPYVRDWKVSGARWLDLAGLALERGALAAAVDLTARAERDDPTLGGRARVLRARVHVAASEPQAALELLQGVSPADLDAPGTLALLDATRAMRGRSAADRLAATIVSPTSSAPDLLARAVVLAGTHDWDRADVLRSRLHTLDPERDTLLETEVALEARQARDAIEDSDKTDLRDLSDSNRERVAELRAIALASGGRPAEAAALTRRLLDTRPDDEELRVRHVLNAWRARAASDEATLAALQAHRDRADAQVGMGLVRLAQEDADGAIAVFETNDRDVERQPIDWRVTYARALDASGDHRRALDVMPEMEALDVETALLRASLASRALGAEAADEAFADLGVRAQATPEVFIAWGQLTADLDARADRLAAGVERFEESLDLQVALAGARLEQGRADEALDVAERALERDGSNLQLWELVVDATVKQSPERRRAKLLDRLPSALALRQPEIVRLAQRLGLGTATPDLVDRAVMWVRQASAANERESIENALAEARILQNAKRWPATLQALKAVARLSSPPPEALRISAQTLAWSGRHDDAISAYGRYLALAPDDVEASRERARVAGWAQRFELANRLYGELATRFPENQAVAAEGRAKRLLYAARWLDAVDAYNAWLDVDPGNEEALFDLAETLTASRNLDGARGVYGSLASREHPNVIAAIAERRLARGARPAVAAVAGSTSSDGYAGQRLLDRSTTGVQVTLPLFGMTDQHVRALAGRTSLRDGRTGIRGQMGRLELQAVPSDWLQVGGSVELTRAGTVVRTWDAAFDVRARVAERVRIDAGVSRATVWENMAAVTGGVAPWGPRGAVSFSAPDTFVEVRAAQAVTGTNRRVTAGASFSQRLVRGRSEIRVLAAAEQTAWRHTDPRFFSPGSFLRLDVGPEWQYAVHVPRFRADRRDYISLSYLAGTDRQGTIYHQPRARLSLQFGPAAFDADTSWVQSVVFKSSDVRFTFRVGG